MTELEFVEGLRGIPAPLGAYYSKGLEKTYVEKRVKGYSPKEKKGQRITIGNDPLLRLVSNYDVSKTEIGMICFAAEISETEDYYYVGQFEVDYLCVAKFSHEVVIVSFEDPYEVSYRCAQNSFLFLDAIIVAGKFLEESCLDDTLFDNQNVVCAIAERCSALAGGKAYLNFYKVLLGCDS